MSFNGTNLAASDALPACQLALARPRRLCADPPMPGMALGGLNSLRVFHSLQNPHWPDHLACSPPQSLHTNTGLAFAIPRVCKSQYFTPRRPGACTCPCARTTRTGRASLASVPTPRPPAHPLTARRPRAMATSLRTYWNNAHLVSRSRASDAMPVPAWRMCWWEQSAAVCLSVRKCRVYRSGGTYGLPSIACNDSLPHNVSTAVTRWN